MYKLNKDKSITRIDFALMNSKLNDKINDYENTYFSPTLFMTDKTDLIIFDEYPCNNNVVLLTRKALKMLSTVKKVSMTFSNCLPDTPIDYDSIKTIDIETPALSDVIIAFANYMKYKMINYLPYSDFAIDHMPMIDKIMINGRVSDLFEEVLSAINKDTKVEDDIIIDKTLRWRYNPTKIIGSPNTYYQFYYKINSAFPIYYKFTEKSYAAFSSFSKFEVSLRWFNKSKPDYATTLQDSDMDDYIYSDPTLVGILTFNLLYPYLLNYYTNELKDMKNNYNLIILKSYYFHTTMNIHHLFSIQSVEPFNAETNKFYSTGYYNMDLLNQAILAYYNINGKDRDQEYENPFG